MNNEIDVIYERLSYFNIGWILKLMKGRRYVIEVNSLISEGRDDDSFFIKILDKWIRLSFKVADHIIVVSDSLVNVMNYRYGIPSKKISVIHNAVDTSKFRPVSVHDAITVTGLEPDVGYICFVGSLFERYYLEPIFKCMSKITKSNKNVKLLIVGDGHKKSTLVGLASELGISDRVVFTGSIQHHIVPYYIGISTACILPVGIESMGFPVKLFEYMACGKPVLVTENPDLKRILVESHACVPIDLTNESDICEKITMLLTDKKLQSNLSLMALQYAQQHSWKAAANKILDVIRGQSYCTN